MQGSGLCGARSPTEMRASVAQACAIVGPLAGLAARAAMKGLTMTRLAWRSLGPMGILAAGALAATVSSAHAASPADDGEWHFTLTPYLWLPNVNSTLKYNLPPGAG